MLPKLERQTNDMADREYVVGRVEFGPRGKQVPDLSKLRVAHPVVRSTEWVDALLKRWSAELNEIPLDSNSGRAHHERLEMCINQLQEASGVGRSASTEKVRHEH